MQGEDGCKAFLFQFDLSSQVKNQIDSYDYFLRFIRDRFH